MWDEKRLHSVERRKAKRGEMRHGWTRSEDEKQMSADERNDAKRGSETRGGKR